MIPKGFSLCPSTGNGALLPLGTSEMAAGEAGDKGKKKKQQGFQAQQSTSVVSQIRIQPIIVV